MKAMTHLLVVAAAFGVFLVLDLAARSRGYRAVHALVARTPVRRMLPRVELDDLVVLIDTSGVLWFHPVLCLQRSATLVILSRMMGMPTELVVGYRPTPFDSHAWAELNGVIVNDRRAYQQRFNVLDRV